MDANEPVLDTPAESGGSDALTAAFARLSRTYELILHATSEGFFGLDLEGRITYANAAAGRMLGWPVEDMLGQSVCALVHGGEDMLADHGRCPLHPPFVGEQSRRRGRFQPREAPAFAVEYSLALIVEDDRCEGAVLVFSDVSARDRAEQALQDSNAALSSTRDQLLQAERMAAIGQLAAGVAHEINTPIGYVNANFGTLQRYLNDLLALVATYEKGLPHLAGQAELMASITTAKEACDLDFLRDDAPDLLRETQGGIATVARIVRELLDFSASGESGEWQWADLQQLLDAALTAANGRVGGEVAVERDDGDLPQVYCLASGIRQAFANLLTNARQAVSRDGRISIRCRRDGASRVLVEIADDGIGIPPENLGRVINPFFTTRPVGSGTGMGLSVADTIIRRHGGTLTLDSTPGQGTTVRILLPLRPGTDPAQTDNPRRG